MMKRSSVLSRLARFLKSNPIILIFFALFIFDALAFDNFLKAESIANLFRSTSTTGIVAVGMTLVIICSDLDLSVGAVQAMGGVVFAFLVNGSFTVGLMAAVAVGIVCGFMTGLLTVKAKLPPFISSLSTQYAVRGIVYIITNQKAIKVRNAPAAFDYLGNGDLFGVIPMPAVIFVALIIIFTIILGKTSYGRSIYATGGNTEAALMMGIKTDRVRMSAFIICGALSAFSGAITTSRLSAAQAVAGENLEMTVIASIVLGGVLLRGGVGKMYNTMFGALFIKLLTTTFNNMSSISTYWQTVITGLCLLVVVFFQNYVLTGKRRVAPLTRGKTVNKTNAGGI